MSEVTWPLHPIYQTCKFFDDLPGYYTGRRETSKGVDTGRAFGVISPRFEFYCCLCSRMVRNQAGWIRFADCLGEVASSPDVVLISVPGQGPDDLIATSGHVHPQTGSPKKF